MFDRRDDPIDLLASLKRFLRLWYGDVPSWYGTSEEKLAAATLPQPLRTLYGFSGNWPGDNWWGSAFANQDVLFPFEMLSMHNEKLCFAVENQGIWKCGTAADGDDPPVWCSFDDGPWVQFSDSLAQFLITFCLQETLFNSEHSGRLPNVKDYLASRGHYISPLWLDGPIVPWPHHGPEPQRSSIYLADGKYLIQDDWCGTNCPDPWNDLPELFKPKAEPLVALPQDESFMNLDWILKPIKQNILWRWE